VPQWAQPLVTSPLVLATLVALSFNLLFRLGIRRTVTMTLDSKAVAPQEIVNFIERAAGSWGARRDVITRVEFAVQQAVEAIVEFCHIKGPITVGISYDEFDIDAELTQLSQLVKKIEQYQRGDRGSLHYMGRFGMGRMFCGALMRGGGCGGRSRLSFLSRSFCSGVSSV
jgi:hypothetical protein